MVFRRDPVDDEAAEAARAGIAAAERVQAGQDVPNDWRVGGPAEEMIEDIVATKFEFTSDDIWESLDVEIAAGQLQEPNERRILGAFIRRLEAAGTIVSTEFNKASTRRNAAPVRVWRTSDTHAFNKWREWGANEDERSPRVQASKEGLDDSIAVNEQRIIRAQEDLVALREQIQRDRNNSDALGERGYNHGLPDFDTVIARGVAAGQQKEDEWFENTIILNDMPSMIHSHDPSDPDYWMLLPYLELQAVDKDTGEVIGVMRLSSKSEDGSIGQSAMEGLVGYQETDIQGLETDRVRAAVKKWFETAHFIGGANAFTGKYHPIGDLEFFPHNVTDNMLEHEREQFRNLIWDLEDDVLDGTTTFEEAIQDPGNERVADPAGYERYRDEFPQGFLNEPWSWMAYSAAGRLAIIKLETDAKNGVAAAQEVLEDMHEEIDQMTCEDYFHTQSRYEDEMQKRAKTALEDGTITSNEYGWILEQWAENGIDFAQWEGDSDDPNWHVWEKAGVQDLMLGCQIGWFDAHRKRRLDMGERDFNPHEHTDPKRRTYSRIINEKPFYGSRSLGNKRFAGHLANRVRNLNRYARVVPCSRGWRVYVGPPRKV